MIADLVRDCGLDIITFFNNAREKLLCIFL